MSRSIAATIIIIALFLGVAALTPANSKPVPARDAYTAPEAAELFTSSTVELQRSSTRICTAFKVGQKSYMTARHCMQGASDYKVEHDGRMSFVKTATVPMIEGEDWAIVHTAMKNDKTATLELGCDIKPVLGMQVAYGGFPYPLDFTFGVGLVTSVLKPVVEGSGSEFFIDLAAAPGASGSAVIDMKSGKVIGILVELIKNRATGPFMVGVQSIKDTSLCDGYDEEMAPAGASPF